MKIYSHTNQVPVTFQSNNSCNERIRKFFGFKNLSMNESNPISITSPEPPVDTFESTVKNDNAVQKSTITQSSIKPFESIVEKSWDLPEKISFQDYDYKSLEIKTYSNNKIRTFFNDRIPPNLVTQPMLLLQKLSKNDDILNNDLVKKYGRGIVLYSDSTAPAKYANAILSNKELYNNENIIKNAKETIYWLRYGVNDSIYDRVLSTPDLYNNKLVVSKLSDILMTVRCKEAAEIVHKILSNEKLYNIERLLDTGYRKMYSANPKIEEEKNVKINFLDKYLSSDLLYKNESITKDINIILSSLNTQKTADRVNAVLDKFIANPELHNNENISNRLANIINTIIDRDDSGKFIDKILSDKKLYDNKNLTENLIELLYAVKTSEDPNTLSVMMDKIAGNPVLYNNISIQKSLSSIICSSTSPDIEQLKTKIINKFSESEMLQNNKNVSDRIGRFLVAIENPYQYKIVEKILDNEKLYNNSNIMNNICSPLFEISNQKLYEITSKILENEDLYNNEQFMKELVQIYENIKFNSLKSVQGARTTVFEHIISNKHLYANKSIIEIMEPIIKEIYNEEQAYFVNKAFDCDKLNSNNTFLGSLRKICYDLGIQSFLETISKEKRKLYCSFIDEISNNDAIQFKNSFIDIRQIMKNSKSLSEFKSNILSQIKYCI